METKNTAARVTFTKDKQYESWTCDQYPEFTISGPQLLKDGSRFQGYIARQNGHQIVMRKDAYSYRTLRGAQRVIANIIKTEIRRIA